MIELLMSLVLISAQVPVQVDVAIQPMCQTNIILAFETACTTSTESETGIRLGVLLEEFLEEKGNKFKETQAPRDYG